ncbi:MAG: hypothetical protein K5945_08965 [Bacteroidaceae bacterium]|nr:hypothetical protein [Bacteroidaceae bacterium]
MEKQVQIQFRLLDIKPLQFVTLTNSWPEGDQQITNQLQFSSDTERRIVRCTANFEYKQNDITQLIITVQSSFEFAREGWSAMYRLQGDEWILPVGLVQHLADITIGATRGILAVRSEENGLPRIILPMMAAAQFVKTNLSLKRTTQEIKN